MRFFKLDENGCISVKWMNMATEKTVNYEIKSVVICLMSVIIIFVVKQPCKVSRPFCVIHL